MRIGLDVTVLHDPIRTGVANYTYEIINALIKFNRTDQFVIFGIGSLKSAKHLYALDFLKYSNVTSKIYKLPARSFRIALLSWQYSNFPPIEFLTGKLDVFHSFNYFMPPQLFGKKVATIFDTTPISHPEWHLDRTVQMDQLRFNRIKQSADQVITISRCSQTDFLDFSPNSKVGIVYPAASKLFQPKAKPLDDKVIRKYGINSPYILSVSTLEPRKNLPTLIKAYLNAKINCQLVLAGALGWGTDPIHQELVAQHPDKIKVIGYVPGTDLPALLRKALCLVYPSFYEGFGMPVLEAMQSGTPVICSNTSSLPEVGGNAVFYINPHKVSDLTAALKKISQDSKLRKQLTQQGLLQAKKFSWQESAKQLNQIYHSL